jgi:nitroimidazol reductase NimA-like FMN-containing flavoprotein (pyridoxamine 5'-phosphate oxidase superfamily)
MRRSELESRDPALFAEVARDCAVGYLTLITADGRPRSIALNFAALAGDIVFHGALSGEKFTLMTAGPPAGFTMVKEYSYLPSYWSAPEHACPATQFFKSVEIQGRAVVVDDPQYKARALQALMEKMQPEGQYVPMDHKLPMYRGALQTVGIFRVITETWTGKMKFGQNEPARLRRTLVGKLRERGAPVDLLTADEIERTLGGAGGAGDD